MPDRVRVALVTARSGPGVDVDVDLPLLSAALANEVDVAVAVWDDPAVDWASFRLAVIRSTWDYPRRLSEFLAWADRCASRTLLANSAALVRWNADKRYLAELADRGVPVVPTSYVAPGEVAALPAGRECVIKPAVGAGARYAARYRPDEAGTAHAHVQRLHADGRTAMVQPYATTVDITGERALVFAGGRFLHAIRKAAVLAPGEGYDAARQAHPGTQSWQPSPAELALSRQALAAVPVPDEPLYARVDVVDDERGEPMVMELELIEPNLFLADNPDSVPLAARTIVQAAIATSEEPKNNIRTF